MGLLGLVVSGCAGVQLGPRISLPVEVARVTLPRPPLPNLTDAATDWLRQLIGAYEDNCISLEVIRGESARNAVEACVIE